MKSIVLKLAKAEGVEIRFLLKDCPYETERYALELKGHTADGRNLVLGISRLTKAELELVSKRLAEAVSGLK